MIDCLIAILQWLSYTTESSAMIFASNPVGSLSLWATDNIFLKETLFKDSGFIDWMTNLNKLKHEDLKCRVKFFWFNYQTGIFNRLSGWFKFINKLLSFRHFPFNFTRIHSSVSIIIGSPKKIWAQCVQAPFSKKLLFWKPPFTKTLLSKSVWKIFIVVMCYRKHITTTKFNTNLISAFIQLCSLPFAIFSVTILKKKIHWFIWI